MLCFKVKFECGTGRLDWNYWSKLSRWEKKGGFIKDSIWVQEICINRDELLLAYNIRLGHFFKKNVSGHDLKKKKKGWWHTIKDLKFSCGKREKIGIVLIQLNLRYCGFALITAVVGALSSVSALMSALLQQDTEAVWIDNKICPCSKMG